MEILYKMIKEHPLSQNRDEKEMDLVYEYTEMGEKVPDDDLATALFYFEAALKICKRLDDEMETLESKRALFQDNESDGEAHQKTEGHVGPRQEVALA